MKLEEFQAKSVFRKHGIPVTAGIVASSVEAAVEASSELGFPVVVKAQVQAGGRGKAGGVRPAASAEEVRRHASAILGMTIGGLVVERVLVDPAVSISGEYYAGITVDRKGKVPVLMVSASGGADIEKVARDTPGKVLFHPIHPERGLRDFESRHLAFALFPDRPRAMQAARAFAGLWQCFMECDASLAEINPLAEIAGGSIVALDAKLVIDDNALFRHPDLEALRLPGADERKELEARSLGLSYVHLDGDIGCMVNGAGLAMATMDLMGHLGGRPANFLDIGGSSNPGKVIHAMKLLVSDPGVRAIFVNVFGGITRCDDVARGFVEALGEVITSLPFVVRLTGTNEEEGMRILSESGIRSTRDMTEGARRAIALAAGEEAMP